MGRKLVQHANGRVTRGFRKNPDVIRGRRRKRDPRVIIGPMKFIL